MRVGMKLGALALAAAAVIALSGCGFIVTDSAGGQGSCPHPGSGPDAVTLTTSQNAAGDQMHIHYEGPATTSLVMHQGLYLEQSIESGYTPTNFEFSFDSNGSGDADAYVIKLNRPGDPGWTVGGFGAHTTYDFTGSMTDLLNGQHTRYDLAGLPQAALLNEIVPAVIGVSCDQNLSAGLHTSVGTGIEVSGLEYSVAQGLYPNNMQINPHEILSSTPTANGADLKLRFTPEALQAFGSFTPTLPESISVWQDNLSIGNATFGDLWAQVLTESFGGNSNAASGGTPVDNGDGTFTVSLTGTNGPLPDGDYLVFTPLTDVSQTAVKLVFSELRYTADAQVSIVDPFTGASSSTQQSVDGQASPAELASTGTDSGLINSGLLAAGSLVIAGCALIAMRLGRRQAQKQPVARNHEQ